MSAGDTFIYKFTLHGSETSYDSWNELFWYPQLNQSLWEYTVTDVNETIVTFQCKCFLNNGTLSKEGTLYQDVAEALIGGEFAHTLRPAFYSIFILPNMSINDEWGQITISQIGNRTYYDEQRETCYYSTGTDSDCFGDCTFDRETGALVEGTGRVSDETYSSSFVFELSETNLWIVSGNDPTSPTDLTPSPSIPEFPSIIAVTALMASILSGTIIYKKRMEKTKN